jgi:hypothetical protein
MTSASPRRAVRKSEINKVVAVLRENGIRPTGAEISPDGTVRLLTDSSAKSGNEDGAAFDAWWREHGQKT